MDLYIKWFDFWLKGEDNGIISDPLVQVFNFGPNNWLKADTYPLPDTSFVKYYISSEKGANTSHGDGKLQIQKSSSPRQYEREHWKIIKIWSVPGKIFSSTKRLPSNSL